MNRLNCPVAYTIGFAISSTISLTPSSTFSSWGLRNCPIAILIEIRFCQARFWILSSISRFTALCSSSSASTSSFHPKSFSSPLFLGPYFALKTLAFTQQFSMVVLVISYSHALILYQIACRTLIVFRGSLSCPYSPHRKRTYFFLY